MTGPARGPAPVATYRLQVAPDHDLDAVAAACADLAGLGVSHLYLSPIFEAAPGSTHGYDVTDPTLVRAEIGGAEAFDRLVAAARSVGLGVVLDIVPNHMATAGRANPYWWDLLAEGISGPVDGFFDVPGEPIVVPVLGAPLADELARGALTVEGEGRRRIVRYAEHEFPVRPDDPGEPGDVAAVLERQHYRLAFWRDGPNYRRFFDIDSLVGVRVEDPSVFAATHSLVLDWCRDGVVDGLRIDHVDGLADPTAYLQRLDREAPGTWLLVEKIVEPGELLPEDWPVAGTTGYEFAVLVDQLAVDPAGEAAMTAAYQELTGDRSTWAETVTDAKEKVVDQLFGRELDDLVALAGPALVDRVEPDAVRRALRGLLVSHDRYRTYVPLDRPGSAEDRRVLEAVAQRARAREDVAAEAVDALLPLLLNDRSEQPGRELATRFQQLSGPVMAKGVEDTASYRYLRLVSLNEVGGDPGSFGTSVDAFHAWAAEATGSPFRLLAGTTHDTKRSEGVRARLDVLAQVPDRWRENVGRWSERLADLRPAGFDDSRTEYLLWQTLVGAWPIDGHRLWAYLEKAVKEAKLRTSWLDPDEGYEADLRTLVERVMGDEGLLTDVGRFVAEIEPAGRTVDLAGLLLRLTAPGVPDLYQGSEDDLRSLVDPDNRRPLDPDIHRRSTPRSELIRTVLGVRRAHPDAFGADGTYEPLDPGDDVLGFIRGGQVAVLVPRFPLTGPADVDGVALPGPWEDHLDGLPVRLLTRPSG